MPSIVFRSPTAARASQPQQQQHLAAQQKCAKFDGRRRAAQPHHGRPAGLAGGPRGAHSLSEQPFTAALRCVARMSHATRSVAPASALQLKINSIRSTIFLHRRAQRFMRALGAPAANNPMLNLASLASHASSVQSLPVLEPSWESVSPASKGRGKPAKTFGACRKSLDIQFIAARRTSTTTSPSTKHISRSASGVHRHATHCACKSPQQPTGGGTIAAAQA